MYDTRWRAIEASKFGQLKPLGGLLFLRQTVWATLYTAISLSIYLSLIIPYYTIVGAREGLSL